MDIENIEPVVLTSKQATKYLGINSDSDVLRVSRTKGKLWGLPAPKYIKAGERKILYKKSDLDDFINQLPTATPAEAKA